jgi:repressor LexA
MSESRGRPPVEEITDPQRRTLGDLRRFIAQQGFPPTIQELADILGISAPSVRAQVNQLVRKGYVKREPKKARGLTVLREPTEEALDLRRVPIVGNVAAGQPILAEENIVGEVLIDSRGACSGRCFALKVQGDSMIDAGIHNGGLVVVRQQPLAESGDIVVALLDGEATVKRLYIRGETIELRPENSAHRPIAVGPQDEIRILGKVVATNHK